NLETYITSIFGIKYSFATKKLRVATSSWSYATTISGYSNTTRKIRVSSPTEMSQQCGSWVTYMINVVSAVRIYRTNVYRMTSRNRLYAGYCSIAYMWMRLTCPVNNSSNYMNRSRWIMRIYQLEKIA